MEGVSGGLRIRPVNALKNRLWLEPPTDCIVDALRVGPDLVRTFA